jgi:hypothetical protein
MAVRANLTIKYKVILRSDLPELACRVEQNPRRLFGRLFGEGQYSWRHWLELRRRGRKAGSSIKEVALFACQPDLFAGELRSWPRRSAQPTES